MIIQDKIPFLYKVAYKYTNERSVADDLVQETIFKALKYKNSFRAGTNLKAWLSTILRNSFINEYRKKSRYFSTDNIASYYGVSDNHTASNNGDSILELEYINKAIKQLPSKLKEPFLLYFKGFTYIEISSKYDVPLGTIKNRIHLARKELKKILVHYRAA